jgi:hypothetical protein
MTPKPHPWPAIASATVLSLLLVACASPGPPRPPSLNLSETVTDLTAQRSGDTVHFHWTTRSDTTDGIDVKGPMTAELCREMGIPTAPAHTSGPNSKQSSPTCTPLPRVPVKAGPSEATDTLPPNLATGPATLIAYRVRIFNSANRAANPSDPTYVAAGSPPPPILQLRANPSRAGATVQWQREPTSNDWIELDRKLISNNQPKKPANTAAPTNNLLAAHPTPPTEVRLQTPKDSPDPGGTLDHTVVKTQTYTYEAQRVRAVTLEGHALELRGALSPAVTVLIADIFPPQPPTGLAAVPGEAAGNLDLSWQPVPDADLAGYLVYRRAANATTFQRLTPKPLVGPAFTDATATPGQHYIYRVTAIDTTGNESQPSNEAEETATPNP